MTATEANTNGRPAIAEQVTVETAAVTIRVVHVADKPMTIAVYEQLPLDGAPRMNDRLIGYIARCRKWCPKSCEARHVLAARRVAGTYEPVLLVLEKPLPTNMTHPRARLEYHAWWAEAIEPLPRLYIAR